MLFSEIEFLVDDLFDEVVLPPDIWEIEEPSIKEQLVDEIFQAAEENPIWTTIIGGAAITGGIFAIDEGLVNEVDFGTIDLPSTDWGIYHIETTVSPTIDFQDPGSSSFELGFEISY